MPTGEFYFLLAGMLDVTEPDKTDPMDEVVRKRVRQAIADKRRGKPGRVRRRR